MFLREKFFSSGIYDWSLRGSVPERLRGVPHDPEPGDASVGRAVVDGDHVLFGRPRHLGDMPWKNTHLTDQETRALHRFGFLGDLKALGTDEAGDTARALITRWVNEYGRWHALAWEPTVTGQRLTNWLRTYDFLNTADHPGFDLTFLESSAVQLRHLSRTVADTGDDVRAIEAAEGLVLAAMCLVGMEALVDTGLAALEVAVSKQVLADGGHFRRNPSIQHDVLMRLVRVRDTMQAGHVETPPWLQHAIDRMAPMLQALRHGDGRLALFNGAAEGTRQEVGAILKAAGSATQGLWSAPHAGFQRMEAGPSVVIADSGAAVLSGADRDAHAGLLSFEFSHGKNRIIVNCGACANRNDAWHDALRATAAHSTLTLDETNAIEIRTNGGSGTTEPGVSCRRNEIKGSVFLRLRHEGYVKSFGIIHSRDIYLAATGDDLRGRDSLAVSPGYMGPQASAFCVRFHLHPDVSAEITGDGQSAFLKLPEHEGWHLRVTGGELKVDDSVYTGAPGIVRPARQISVSGPCRPTGSEIKWSLIKEG